MVSKRALGMCLSVEPVCRAHAAGECERAGAASYRRSGPPASLEEPREPWGGARALSSLDGGGSPERSRGKQSIDRHSRWLLDNYYLTRRAGQDTSVD